MPERFVPDTNCIVAAVCDWHEHHSRALGEIRRRLAAGQIMVIAGPTLIESYSVLTRLPPPRRLSPRQAVVLLDEDFLTHAGDVVVLSAMDYRETARMSARRGVAGGRIYDATIAACARIARANVLLTFNASDFRDVVSQDIQIVVPD